MGHRVFPQRGYEIFPKCGIKRVKFIQMFSSQISNYLDIMVALKLMYWHVYSVFSSSPCGAELVARQTVGQSTYPRPWSNVGEGSGFAGHVYPPILGFGIDVINHGDCRSVVSAWAATLIDFHSNVSGCQRRSVPGYASVYFRIRLNVYACRNAQLVIVMGR